MTRIEESVVVFVSAAEAKLTTEDSFLRGPDAGSTDVETAAAATCPLASHLI